jgi:hypothetical protein
MKKKIRAIQYGVGPIGAALVRLLREKRAIEVIGAIDTDLAKARRDLGAMCLRGQDGHNRLGCHFPERVGVSFAAHKTVDDRHEEKRGCRGH